MRKISYGPSLTSWAPDNALCICKQHTPNPGLRARNKGGRASVKLQGPEAKTEVLQCPQAELKLKYMWDTKNQKH